MKIYKYVFILLIGGVLASCEDYFGEDSNADPDSPITVSPNVILPQVQLRLAYTYGGDFTRYVGIYTKHVDGVSRQFAVIGQYGITSNDVDAAWANIYTGTLNANRLLLKLARDNGYNHYAGIALALECYTMMASTDLWGDMAYSDAFKFNENGGVYQPVFDTQEEIYNQIFTNLAEARDLLSGDAGGNAPGNADVMYGGNATKWIQFCNVLEARGKLHLAEVNGAAYGDALTALNGGGFNSSSDDANVTFGTGATENAPWYQYIEQRDDCETGAFYVSLLEEYNDPRIATYGYPHDNTHPIWTKDQSLQLLSYTEQEFIRAEAALQAGDQATAYAAYLNGIESSFAEALVADEYAAYVAQSSVGVGEGNLTLENVITQKYLALYTSPEVFNDWRRTNIPALTPVTGTEIPRRLPYAQTELFSNPDNVPSPADVNIFTRVWWDK
ncbi:MAG TPA: SusD/RagB family nutrient-binding outer membrane lipoprotein [Saprospiraceae bacterium]|nr:SusD/RagB family nutrient-binding outer membrane lipoprotein [Saprospiraceae bacterium]